MYQDLIRKATHLALSFNLNISIFKNYLSVVNFIAFFLNKKSFLSSKSVGLCLSVVILVLVFYYSGSGNSVRSYIFFCFKDSLTLSAQKIHVECFFETTASYDVCECKDKGGWQRLMGTSLWRVMMLGRILLRLLSPLLIM